MYRDENAGRLTEIWHGPGGAEGEAMTPEDGEWACVLWTCVLCQLAAEGKAAPPVFRDERWWHGDILCYADGRLDVDAQNPAVGPKETR